MLCSNTVAWCTIFNTTRNGQRPQLDKVAAPRCRGPKYKTIKSNCQRRTEIQQTRKLKRAHAENLRAREQAKARARALRGKVLVNESVLRSDNSYDTPDFVRRGYYIDRPFTCKDCGAKEIWTDTQQKWWYEVAH